MERWDTHELSWEGGAHSNPFRDVKLTATFRHESGRPISVNGFFDGGATWGVRQIGSFASICARHMTGR